MSKDKSKDWQKFKEELERDALENEADLGEEMEVEAHSNASLDHPSYANLEEKLTLAEQESYKNKELALRAHAELDNVRRRAERDVANAHRYGVEKLITALLPVMDSLEQALQLVDPKTQASMYEGLELTMKLFLDVLAKNEVSQIDPLGESFNPAMHEAMSMQDAPGVSPNAVLAVFQKGYQLHDRIIRPARVIVAKPKPTE